MKIRDVIGNILGIIIFIFLWSLGFVGQIITIILIMISIHITERDSFFRTDFKTRKLWEGYDQLHKEINKLQDDIRNLEQSLGTKNRKSKIKAQAIHKVP